MLLPGDEIVVESGDDGICAAYNRLLDRTRDRPDCELLVLMHDDLQLIDPRTRTVLLAAAADRRVGLLGLVGARCFRGARWWEGAQQIGAVYETRGLLPARPLAWSGPVDAVDGQLLALTPAAMQAVRFDGDTFPGFHGYDIDVAAQVRQAGLRVEVVALDAYHRTKATLGDSAAFNEAHRRLDVKWSRSCGLARRGLNWLRRQRSRVAPASDPDPRHMHYPGPLHSPEAWRRAATSGQTQSLWLPPRDDQSGVVERLRKAAMSAGVTVSQVRLLTPPTAAVPSAQAAQRAVHLALGGQWPVPDLVQFTVTAPELAATA